MPGTEPDPRDTAVAGVPLRVVAFDWGGVFTEGTFDAGAVRDLTAWSGIAPERVAEAYYPLMAEFETGAFDLTTFYERLGAQLALPGDEAAFRATLLGAVRERPATYALLDGIPSEYRLAVLSNNVPELCDRVRDDPRLARVDPFVFSNEIGVRKPDARAYDALVQRLGVAPEATLFIDDSARNVEAARAFGLRALHLDDVDAFLTNFEVEVPGADATAARTVHAGTPTSPDEGSAG